MRAGRMFFVFLLALGAGLALVVASSFWQHRPPQRLAGALNQSRWGSALVQEWIRTVAQQPWRNARDLQRGDPAPDLALPGLDGRVHHLSDWRGKRVLVNFWATWCLPCRREIPALNEAQARYGSGRVQIVGVALDDPAQVRAFIRQVPIHYPVLLGMGSTPNPSKRFGDSLGALPFSVLIDRKGRIRATYYGPLQPSQLGWWLK